MGVAPSHKSLPESHGSVTVPVTASFWRKLFAFSGPGYLVAVGYMDPGNWATDIAGGARFGYTLLSVILLSNLKGHGAEPAAARLESQATRSAPLTAEGTIVGTLQYMAPEQLEGKEADARTDLWALGGVLYEMVTGKRAFEGTSAANLMAAILEHEPPPITSLQPLTPQALDRLVRRCLGKAADDRPDTAHDVADTPKWTPDGRGLAFFWQNGGRLSLGMLRVDGSSPADVLELADAQGNPPPTSHRLSSWSPDGRELALVLESDLAVARVEGSRATFRVLAETPHSEQSPEFSPDGRWLAYSSDESRRQEIYVQPYPGPGLRTRVSIEGGTCPAWSGDGRQLFFLEAPDASGRGRMMVADFDPASPTRTGTPRRLFEFGPDLLFPSAPARSHVVAPDGQRVYVVQRRPDPPRPPVTHVNLILNWFEELKAKVPTTR